MTFKKSVIILFGIWMLTVVLGLTPWIYSDGAGDYSWLRSFFMDGNLDCSNEFAHYVKEFEKKYGWPGPNDDLFPAKTRTGYQANKYPIGTAILWSPFFIMGHAATILDNDFFGAKIPIDGYSKWYVFFVTLGSNFYAFLGLLIAFKIASRLFPVTTSFLATVGIWFASSIPVYMYLYPSMPHNTALFTVAIFYYYWLKTGINRSLHQWIMLGILGGLMVLTRMESVVLFILPFYEMAFLIIKDFGTRKELKKYLFYFSSFGIFFIIIFSIQMLIWKAVFGSYFLNPYTEMAKIVSAAEIKTYGFLPNASVVSVPKSTLDSLLEFLLYPHLVDTLFGTSYGIYFWTPILLLASIGLVFLVKRNPRMGLSSLVSFFLLVYITSHARKAGMSFGDRYLIKASIFYVLGLAAFFEFLKFKIKNVGLAIIIAFFILWNGLLIVQYSTGLINRQGSVSFKRLVTNQFTRAPEMLIEKSKVFILGRSSAYRN